jgi:hypothetical protein
VFYQPQYSAILASVISYYAVWITVALCYFSLDLLDWISAYLLCVPRIHPEVLNKILFHGVPFALPTLPVLVCGLFSCGILPKNANVNY